MPQQRMPEQPTPKHWSPNKSPRKLPAFPLDLMTQGQLREFIPQLIRMVSADRNTKRKMSMPMWWPPDVSFDLATIRKILQHSKIAILRSIVRNCYKYHGQENLLIIKKPPPSPRRVPLAQRPPAHTCFCPQENVTVNTNAVNAPVASRQTFSEIYICFFCEEEFYSKDEMRQHQAACMERPPELQAIGTPPRPKKQTDFPLLSPKRNLFEKPKPTKDVYVKSLNLIPMVKAEQIRARARKSTEIDCDIIDLEEPMSPTTPKTPTSLMSQLSRDLEASSRKRLSYSESSHNDHESVHSCGSEEVDEAGKPKEKQSLLNIAVSSLLGQRIQKHVCAEIGYQVCSDREAFCKTPEKNEFLDRLRNRIVAYNITFRPRKQMNTFYYHSYKFSSTQRKEFWDRMRTGLNVHSRKFLKSVPKCFVLLEKLTKEDISEWLPLCAFSKKKKVVKSETDDAIFPDGPVLLDNNIDKLLGLKRRSEDRSSQNNPLTLENVVSEHVNAEVSKQKLTLYRSLLSEFSMKPAYVNVKQLKIGQKQPALKKNQAKQIERIPKQKLSVGQSTLKTKSSVVVLDDIGETLVGKCGVHISDKLSDPQLRNSNVCKNPNQKISKDMNAISDKSSPHPSLVSRPSVREVNNFNDRLLSECGHTYIENETHAEMVIVEKNDSRFPVCQQVFTSAKSSPVKTSADKLQSDMLLDKLHINTDMEALQRSLPSPASSTKSDPVCDGIPHLTMNGTLSEPPTPDKHKLHSVRRVIDMDNFTTNPLGSNKTDPTLRRSKRPRSSLNIWNIRPAKVRKVLTEPSIVTA